MGDPGFEDDESTMMMPSFSEGSFFADRYRVERLLGSGAMGRVYAATELHSGRTCAIKVLHKERLGEEETVARFEREANVLASIGHPCIVEIFAFHHTRDGSPYLAMELLEGVTLKTRLRSGRFEDPRELQPILDGVSGALDAAHQRGIVHRDLKPDNLFLPATGEPRVKLVDFGLSRIARADKDLTHSGMILGTPRYMAPEQIRDASSAGPAGDIYALGILIFEGLTGQSPYPAQDYGQLLGCVLEARTTPLSQVRPELGEALSAVLSRAMAPEPVDRFQSCAAFAAAFGHAIGSPSRVEEVNASPRASGERPARQRVPSMSNIPVNKSTLAFDAAAVFGGSLPDVADVAPGAWDIDERTTPEHDAAKGRSGERALPHDLDGGPTSRDSAPLGGGYPGYPAHPSAPAPVEAPPAKGGDTLFLGDVGVVPPGPGALAPSPPFGAGRPPAPSPAVPSPAAPSFSSPGLASAPGYGSPPGTPSPYGASAGYGSQPGTPSPYGASVGYGSQPGTPSPFGSAGVDARLSPAPGPSSLAPAAHPSFAPAAAAPPKKSRTGIVLFLLALVLVVAFSALAGFALRAHMRGDLDLPFEIPGLSP